MDSTEIEECVPFMGKTIHEEICRFSVVIVDLEREWEHGSGTLIRIDNHIFVATTGHVVCENPSGRLVVVSEKHGYTRNGTALGILNAASTEKQSIDVGFLDKRQRPLPCNSGNERGRNLGLAPCFA